MPEVRTLTAPDGRGFTLSIPEDYVGPRDFRWPVSFEVIDGGNHALRGKPSDLNAKRCQAKYRYRVPIEQCPNWASRGSNFCRFHGGTRKKKTAWRTAGKSDTILAKYYSRRVGPTLAAKLAELSQGDTARMRHSLAEEIDLSRVMAEKAIHRFEKVCLDGKNKDGKEFSSNAKEMTSEMLRKSLKFVSETVEKSARVRALDASTVEAEHIEYVGNEIAKILKHHLPEDHDLVVRVLNDVQAIQFPNSGNVGVNPKEAAKMIRALVKDMDSTVVGE